MKRILYAIGLFLLPFAAYTYEAHVVHVEPNMITIEQYQCEDVHYVSDNSSVGSVIGALVGGSLGYQSGSSTITVLGAAMGSIVGNDIGKNTTSTNAKRVCKNVPVLIQQGERVTFEYKGRRFTRVIY